MELRNQWKTLVIAFLLPYLQLMGCSLIGLGIGAISDSGKPDYDKFTWGAIDRVEAGTIVTIILETGTIVTTIKSDGSSIKDESDELTIKGEYIGVVERPMYSKAYQHSLAESGYGGYLPKLGEAVTILTTQSSREGLYLGIDRNFVLMKPKYEQDTIGVYLDSVVAVEAPDGRQLKGEELRTLVYNATVLSKYYVLIWEYPMSEEQRVAIPYEAVDLVSFSVDASKSGALTGFLIGAGIDALVITLAVISCNQASKEAPECNSKTKQPEGCDSKAGK